MHARAQTQALSSGTHTRTMCAFVFTYASRKAATPNELLHHILQWTVYLDGKTLALF